MTKNNKLNEIHTECYDNGNKMIEATFVNGRWNGPYTCYYENGVVKQKSNFENDKLHGVQYLYNESGVLVAKTTFEYGKKGHQYFYYPNGKLRERNVYIQDVKLIKYKYYENGVVLAEEEYYENAKHGKYYYENGQIEYINYYWHGLLHGDCIGYFKYKKILANRYQPCYVSEYEYGVKVSCIVYDRNGNIKSEFKDRREAHKEEMECVICYENIICTTFFKCQHKICYECYDKMHVKRCYARCSC